MPDDYYVSQYSGEEIDDAIARALPGGAIDSVLSSKPNPNLLDNWYFGNPVDQRGGYVVPPGVAYAGASSGTTTKYYTVKSTYIYNDVKYAVFDVDGSECNVPFYTCVRGYTGDGYGIDRWKLINDTSTLLITNEGVKLVYDNPGWHLSQLLQGVLRKGITYTYSVLYKASGNSIRLVCSWGNNKFFFNNLSPVTDEWSLATVTGTIPEDAVIDYEQIVIQSLGSGAGTIDIKAAKFELGSQQTLAHQDAGGNWVLNEIPNYGEQLARCQRYAVKLNGKYWMPLNSDGVLRLNIPLPVTMRAKPSVTFSQELKNTGTVSFDDNLSDKNQIQFYMADNGGWVNVYNIFATADL